MRCQWPLARPILQRPDGSGVPGVDGMEGAGIGTGVAILGGQAKGLSEVGERGPDVSEGARRLRRGLTQRVHYWSGPIRVAGLGGPVRLRCAANGQPRHHCAESWSQLNHRDRRGNQDDRDQLRPRRPGTSRERYLGDQRVEDYGRGGCHEKSRELLQTAQ